MPFGVTLAPRYSQRKKERSGRRMSGNRRRERKKERRPVAQAEGEAALTLETPTMWTWWPQHSPSPAVAVAATFPSAAALPTTGSVAVARARLRIRRCHRAIPALPTFGFAAATAGFAAVALPHLRILRRRLPHHRIRRGRRLSTPSSSSERARWAEEQSTTRASERGEAAPHASFHN
uniref:Uncharacterized protein n=1 Tax=Oryza glumipatula TaxID=40148 RepID=A0A0E0B7S0_9ORYZ